MVEFPTLFVTGATGQFGRLVVDALLETVPAEAVVAGVRDLAKAEAALLRERGVRVRIADYSRPDTLEATFEGVDRLLLVSGNEIGQRTAQHGNVIRAAKAAGVGLIAYTSILHADTTPLFLATEHRETETALAASGVPFTLLRNGWYTEVFTWRIPAALEHGVFIGAAGEGRISGAARADYARAAAAVLTGDGHADCIYELAGDTAFTLREFVDVVAEAAGRAVGYRDMAADALHATLLAGGVPELFARIVSDTDAGVARGALFDEGGALGRLIGRRTTPFGETVAAHF